MRKEGGTSDDCSDGRETERFADGTYICWMAAFIIGQV